VSVPGTPAAAASDARLRLSYPEALPITAQRESLLEIISANQVVVVAGETGSGKSTQLPKLCLELGRGADKLIGHTQPRRLAARTVAARIAEELETELGDVVGYKVRFDDQVSDGTMVKLMTDGVLLAELRRDRRLEAYDTILIDEAHERSLNIDFLLGYLTELLPHRPDLKLIVTSATIDTDRFAQHFSAPVVEVSGRTYPVETRYREPETSDQVEAIRSAVDELRREGPGDILVFLSGQREIHDTARALSEARLPDTDVLPLYARLSAAEQQRAFRPHKGRRIVLATNVAETSITVPGVRYVVDTGTARISRYNRRTKLQRLPIEPVSQASANQRAGRCGRVAPGICIRLYAEDDFDARPEFTEPEILRTNLASVILQMADLELGDVESFPFIDPPDSRAVRDAVALLDELGALTDARPVLQLTSDGGRMARLPVDPRFGRMLLAAADNGALREVTLIVAALSIQDPRERPTGEEQKADESHARFAVPGSDFLSWLSLWEYLRTEQRSRTGNAFRRMCRAEHLNYVRVREWQDLVRQLRQATHDLKLPRSSGDAASASPDAVHRSLLAGLLSHIGMWDRTTRDYRGARQVKFSVASRSGMAKSAASWVMAGELVETGRLWARMVARIDPSWVEPLADHLVKRTRSEPHWSRDRGQAVVDEQVSLYGLPIVPRRAVPLDRHDPELARLMFIDHALVDANWHLADGGPRVRRDDDVAVVGSSASASAHRGDDGRVGLGRRGAGAAPAEKKGQARYGFVEANRRVMEKAQGLEARARRSDLEVDEHRLAVLYDERVPDEVVSSRAFERWWKGSTRAERDALTFTLDDLLGGQTGVIDAEGFPLTWSPNDGASGSGSGSGLELPLTYVFEPGADDDGVTIHVPLAVLPQLAALPATGVDWHVPGHRLELVTALIRSLPKTLRRELSPAPERAVEALDGIGPADGPMVEVLARKLTALAGVRIAPGDLGVDRLSRHLRLRFSVEDDKGRIVGAGRDLAALWSDLATQARRAVTAAVPGPIEQRGLTGWPGGTLPRTIETVVDGQRVVAYPALIDEGSTVGVRVVTNPRDQQTLMARASRRLLLLAAPRTESQVERRLRVDLGRAAVGRWAPDIPALAADCIDAAADRLVAARGGAPWDEDAYEHLADAARTRLTPLAVAAARQAGAIVATTAALQERLDKVPASMSSSVEDMRSQLRRLVHPGFVAATGLTRLQELPRYIEALRLRLDKLRERPDRDVRLMADARTLEDEYAALLATLPRSRRIEADVQDARWLLEELRVSLFAQTLGTPTPVSPQRLSRALAALRR
jgi:ATP-dependent helicase HrpA